MLPNFELRFVEREVCGRTIQGHTNVCESVVEKMLQYRIKRPACGFLDCKSICEIVWSDWQDVPVVEEE